MIHVLMMIKHSDDPILVYGLRQDKKQPEGKGIMCGWDSFDFIYTFV